MLKQLTKLNSNYKLIRNTGVNTLKTMFCRSINIFMSKSIILHQLIIIKIQLHNLCKIKHMAIKAIL